MSWGFEVLGNLTTSIVNLAGNVSLHGIEGFFSVPELTSWRVTPDNPVRYTGSLDVERCAALHNEILWHGWNKSGGRPEDFPGVNWYEQYRDDGAGDSRKRFSAPLAAFLDKALSTSNVAHSFFYHLSGLNAPSYMWDNHEWYQDDPDKYRYLTLYLAHSMASHPDGLVYDQREHKAIMQMSIHDRDVAMNGRQEWLPLEVILTGWLDMLDVGKVQAVPDDVEWQPWIMVPYSQKQLDATVAAFDRLVDAIESRMPNYQGPSVAESQHVLSASEEVLFQPVLSVDDVEAAGIKPGFAHSFLTKAKRPGFRYIAPGLAIPTPETLKLQPFADIKRPRDSWLPEDEEMPDEPYPLLIFSSSENYETWRDPPRHPKFPDSDRPFSYPYHQLPSFSAGLYFSPTHGGPFDFEDGVKLVLPEPIGAFGYARKADGSRFGENIADATALGGYGRRGGTFSDLFQLGYNPYAEMHDVQLEQVLDAWCGLVESGEWMIGEDGVEDTIQKFKDADTRSKWNKYVVPIKW
ncbi:hypothetical protein PFICI_13248 [Pestalotiopsis fici W106-1]|uniref:Uncharacterized protein n=1 Tax=Pestalotiopsis fici (strain W106-1 / CGMCC3.15140) TaxID=1229662 RepID=W3WLZ0_PESFW|nr:uncharacterized protein PFICI_13248 [Pestalotiopsis fici W106-1]ETS74764.1 hypothetical protein PFICI_13248 [Pestalotiopsis fici W106-1]